nr:DNA replication terminus site-binding [Ipomoea batatas]
MKNTSQSTPHTAQSMQNNSQSTQGDFQPAAQTSSHSAASTSSASDTTVPSSVQLSESSIEPRRSGRVPSEDEDVSDKDMPDLNFRFTQAQSSSGNRARSEANSDSLSSGGRRKRKISDRDEPITSQSFHNVAMMLSETLVMVGDKLSKSIGTELTLQEKVQQLDKELIQIDGLSNEEYLMALIKLLDRPNQMLVFFSLPSERRLEWVRAFRATH